MKWEDDGFANERKRMLGKLSRNETTSRQHAWRNLCLIRTPQPYQNLCVFIYCSGASSRNFLKKTNKTDARKANWYSTSYYFEESWLIFYFLIATVACITVLISWWNLCICIFLEIDHRNFRNTKWPILCSVTVNRQHHYVLLIS